MSEAITKSLPFCAISNQFKTEHQAIVACIFLAGNGLTRTDFKVRSTKTGFRLVWDDEENPACAFVEWRGRDKRVSWTLCYDCPGHASYRYQGFDNYLPISAEFSKLVKRTYGSRIEK